MIKWIKAKDKLPEHRQRVIFCKDIYTMVTAIFLENYSTKCFDYKNVFITDDNREYNYFMHPKSDFHWSYLPLPPETFNLSQQDKP